MIWPRGGGDPGRLLATVLEREQREVGEPGDVALRREDAEDATLVARPVPVVEISIHQVAKVEGNKRSGRMVGWRSRRVEPGDDHRSTSALKNTTTIAR